MRNLFQIKHDGKESVASYIIYFRAASLESRVRLKNAYLDALTPQLQLQARDVVAENFNFISSELIRTLFDIVGLG